MSTVGADKTNRSGDKVPGNDGLSADFTLVLAIAAVVIIEIVMRGTAERFPEIVFKKELPVLLNGRLDNREMVGGKFVVFRGVGIIEGPLLERDISADEVQEPANSFVLFLNYSK